MTINLDHIILPVKDIERSAAFYAKVLGLRSEPDALIRISPTLVLQLIGRPPTASYHLAFSMSKSEFEGIFEQLKMSDVPYGNNFDTVGSMSGPGRSHGSERNAKCFYFKDPDGHMLEIMHYESVA